jgi:hypothetical protein
VKLTPQLGFLRANLLFVLVLSTYPYAGALSLPLPLMECYRIPLPGFPLTARCGPICQIQWSKLVSTCDRSLSVTAVMRRWLTTVNLHHEKQA